MALLPYLLVEERHLMTSTRHMIGMERRRHTGVQPSRSASEYQSVSIIPLMHALTPTAAVTRSDFRSESFAWARYERRSLRLEAPEIPTSPHARASRSRMKIAKKRGEKKRPSAQCVAHAYAARDAQRTQPNISGPVVAVHRR